MFFSRGTGSWDHRVKYKLGQKSINFTKFVVLGQSLEERERMSCIAPVFSFSDDLKLTKTEM